MIFNLDEEEKDDHGSLIWSQISADDQNSKIQNICNKDWKCSNISMTMKLTRLECEYPTRGGREKETEREFLSCKKRTLKRERNALCLRYWRNEGVGGGMREAEVGLYRQRLA